MQLKIEIPSAEVKTRRVEGRGDRKGFDVRYQEGYAHTGKQYPEPIELELDDGDRGYHPGMYQLSDESVFIGPFKQLKFQPVLIALEASASARPAVKAAG